MFTLVIARKSTLPHLDWHFILIAFLESGISFDATTTSSFQLNIHARLFMYCLFTFYFHGRVLMVIPCTIALLFKALFLLCYFFQKSSYNSMTMPECGFPKMWLILLMYCLIMIQVFVSIIHTCKSFLHIRG